MNRRKPKTVFVLGAGFSAPAGIPSQAELMSTVLDYDDLPSHLVTHRKQVFRFIKKVYGLSKERAKDLDLEDIYTPLHQAVTRNDYLKGFSPAKLKDIEDGLNLLVSHVIDHGKFPTVNRDGYVHSFLKILLDQKRKNPTTDKFSIISLNWDILLDKRLFEATHDEGVVDYCCHYTGIDQNENRMMPGILASERNRYRVKLIKMHGSLNWLVCPQCNRLFANKSVKIGIRGFEGNATCSFCPDVRLGAALLLPSFRKDLASFHFQHVWNQAATELTEATKIVFIGYSFPLADFDFRSLITSRVGDSQVEIVLFDKDGKPNEAGERYHRFFGPKIKDPIRYDGIEEYVKNHMKV